MCLGTAFLSLCLFASVQAATVTPIGPYEMKTLTGATADGSAVSIPAIDFKDSLPFPISDWYVAGWVQIKPATADTARLLQFKGFKGAVPVECYVTWASTAPPTFTFGVTDHAVVGYEDHRHEDVWFHLLMGCLEGTSYGYISFRAASSNQFSVTWSETITIKRTSAFMAPSNANPFNVSST